MGYWPVYKLDGLTTQKLDTIKKKVQEKTLTLSDIDGTDLLLLYDRIPKTSDQNNDNIELWLIFKDLLKVSLDSGGTIYALCDVGYWEPEASFYSTYEEMETAFATRYACHITPWEELDDEELKLWIERSENELDCIPFVMLHEDSEGSK